MKKRKEILQKFDLDQRIKSAKKFQGSITEILVESENKNEKLQGYTPNYIKVNIPYKKELINQFIKIKLNKLIKDWPVTFE